MNRPLTTTTRYKITLSLGCTDTSRGGGKGAGTAVRRTSVVANINIFLGELILYHQWVFPLSGVVRKYGFLEDPDYLDM